jgi:hypothetical protein
VDPAKSLGANLAFGRLQTRVGVVGLWILQKGDATEEQARRLRICLMRLHAEQEVLDLVLKQLARKRLLTSADPDAATDLNNYFDKSTRLINRSTWGGVPQSAILSAWDSAEQVTPPSSRANLTERFDGARKQVWAKIEDYQARRAAVRVTPTINLNGGNLVLDKSINLNQSGTGNIANIAEFMSNVTNNVNNNLEKSQTSEDVKALIKQLTDQIKDISSRADPKTTQRMASDLQTLSSEVAQPEPRRAWYELSLKGLKEAAEAVGSIATPIVATVTKLMPLLLT